MYDYDAYLLSRTDTYASDCHPKKDADGDPMNCIECDNSECEHYKDYHEIDETDDFEPDYGLQAEMDEALLWGI